MANLYVYLDNRNPRKDGTGLLRLALTHKRSTVYESLDIHVRPDEWDASKCQIIGRPDKKFQNIILRKKFADASVCLHRIEFRSDFESLSARDILTMLTRGANGLDRVEDSDYVLPVYKEYIELCRKTATRICYKTSLSNLTEYEGDIDSLRFKDINVSWLRRYQSWLLDERKMSVNGANVYMRNLRAVFNFAISNEFTSARYPFKEIDMSTTEPDKRYIPYDTFLEWATYPVTDNRVMYRDLFLLSVFLCGIRPVDLLSAKKSQIVNGRLEYCPQKLNGHTKLSVKVEPEAWEIIRKYEGQEHLLRFMEVRSDRAMFMKTWNKAIRAVGEDETVHKVGRNGKKYYVIKHHGIVPYMTIYYARSCFASFSYNELNTPMDVISQALGHKNGLRVTNFYVKRDTALADDANRALIDLITKDMARVKAEKGW